MMNRLRIFLSLGCLVLSSLISTTYASNQKPTICTNTYVLCSSASCQPIPGLPGKALCHCSIRKGKNMGFSTCVERKERKTSYGQQALLSTFSPGGGHRRYLTCPAGSPWAYCLDKPCLTDKRSKNPNKAYCTCDIVHKKNYVTFVGGCNQKNCHKAIWSGASVKSNQQFIKAFGRDPSKIQCPIKK